MNPPVTPPPPPQRPSGPPKPPTRPQPVNVRAELTFNSALERPAAEREAFIAEACRGEGAMLAEVRALLAAHDAAGGFMQEEMPLSPEIEHELARLKPEEAGERIGRYKLLQEIGAGGFGVVWMAEQMEPVVRRVALKIIKMGMDTREVIARFEAERQALAMMDHPNIAKVFDAGATQFGRPFFVMELVKGIPITQFCDEAGLGTRERLALFADVCAAINHAHQKGVIHRDIKPSNVMITLHGDKPVVKVIDFGIAKATQGPLTDKTLFTRFEQFIGTPVYMSPEQATMSGLDIDTRSDIYALGILLYELLTGKPPFDAHTLASAGYEEMRRIIREVEPPKPSSRLSTVMGEERTVLARARHIEPGKVKHLIEPDLDWIVMKAIDKDRNRRYETANGLAMDIDRFLTDRPVVARPPSAAYQFQKFARRHKAGLRVATAIAAVLVAATLVSAWQAVRATRAEQQARKSEAMAQTEAIRANEQKLLAEGNLAKTEKAEQEATHERIRADRETEAAQQNLFYAQMHLGQQAWREHRGLGHMRELLARWLPDDGAPDRRGWEWFYLNSLPYQNVRTLTEGGSSNQPCTVAWHVTSNRLAVGNKDGTIRIWDADREQTILTLKGPGSAGGTWWESRWLAWSPDGSQLAAGFHDRTVHVWDAGSGREIAVVRGHKSMVWSVAYSSDGMRLASWSLDGAIKIWYAKSGRLTVDLTHPGGVSSGAWSPDDRLLASGHSDGTVTISGTHAADKIVTLRGHIRQVHALAWSPDSTQLASTSYDHTARIWDVASEKMVLGPLRHGHEVTSVAWEPNGERLATGSSDESVKIWNATTGHEDFTLRGHRDNVASLAWGPDGRLASGSGDGSVRIWNSICAQESSALPGEVRVTSVSWSPDGKRLASGDDDGTIRIWDSAARQEVLTLRAHDKDRSIQQFGLIRSLAWSPDGTHLASAGLDGTAKVWEVASGREVFTLPADHGAVWSVAWSPDGKRLAAGSLDGMIRVVEGLGHTPKVNAFQAHEGDASKQSGRAGVRALAWSPQGDRLASGGFDRLVKLWDPVLGNEVATLQGHRGWIMSVAWSPDGQRLASSDGDRLVMAWDAETGERLTTMRGHNDFVDAVAWSPDGTRLASAGLDNSVRIWDPLTGEETFVLRGDSGMFHDISWNPDGARLAAASSDGQIWIWDATRGFERDTTPRAMPYIDRLVASGTARGADLFWNAKAYVRAGKPREALVAVKDDAHGLGKLARLFQEQGNTPLADAARIKALALLERQRAAEPDNEMVASELADLLLIPSGQPLAPEQEQKRLAAMQLTDPWGKLAAAYHLAGDPQALDALLKQHPAAQVGIAEMLIATRRTAEAIPVLAEASARQPDATLLALKVAALQAWFGKDADHAATSQRMLAWAKEATKPEDLERVAKLISLRPAADAALREAAVTLARRAVELGPKSAWLPNFYMALGIAEYRHGRYPEAEQALLATKTMRDPWGQTVALYRAMSLFQQGKPAEARALFTDTEARINPFPKDEQNPLGNANADDLILWLACKEAKALLAEPDPSAK